MNQDIKKHFHNAGFTEKQTLVYLALLGEEFLTVTQIANKSGLKRSIIYVVLDELIEDGFAIELSKGKVQKYQAADPEIVLAKLRLATSGFASLMPYFSGLYEKSGAKPKITVIENERQIRKIYEEISTYKNVFAISPLLKLEEVLPGCVSEWVDAFKQGVFQSQNFKQILIQEKNVGPVYKKLTAELEQLGVKTKILKTKSPANKVDIVFFGSRIAITSLDKKPYLILIDSKVLYAGFKAFFEILWDISETEH